jgi:hypothetical protein
MDESNSRNASSTRDATMAGRPSTVITSGTKGTLETAGMPSTAWMPITAVTPAIIFISFSLFFHFSLKRRADKTKCKEFLLSASIELFTGKLVSSRLLLCSGYLKHL